MKITTLGYRILALAIACAISCAASATAQRFVLGDSLKHTIHHANKKLSNAKKYAHLAKHAHPTQLKRGVKPVKLDNWYDLNYDSILLEPSYLFIPLIFEQQQMAMPALRESAESGLNYDREWLDDAIYSNKQVNYIRYNALISNPEYAPYNINSLPEPPKSYVIVTDPVNNLLTVTERVAAGSTPKDLKVETDPINYKHWLHSFNGSLHFSQSYLSKSWYQGGNNNLTALLALAWSVKLNEKLHPNYLFSNVVSYRLGVNAAPQDTVRSYSISEDLFKINTNAGIKAWKHWYYSAQLQFQTQIFNNYPLNSNDLKASFLSPAELNIGVGMTYSNKSKDGWRTFDLSISPIAYDLKVCRDIVRINPETFGIEAGRHTKSSIGSTLKAKWMIKFTANIGWNSQFYLFTNYKNVLSEWENTLDFTINKYLSTSIFVHLRYDTSTDPTLTKWKHFQLKEVLSFGLTYKFGVE